MSNSQNLSSLGSASVGLLNNLVEEEPAEPKRDGGIVGFVRSLTWERCQVGVIFTLFVILRAMDRVFNKRVNDRMVNYQIMYVNVFWPIGVQIMTYGLCGLWVLYHRYQLKDPRYGCGFFSPFSSIATAAGRPYPQWRLALFSFWDQLNAIITSLPSPFIDVTSQSIMSNFVVVWTVLISIVYLNARYSQEHYLGCALILASAAVSVVVQLQTGNPPLGEYNNTIGQLVQSSPLWYAMYIIGTVPNGISNCYKQKCLKGVDLEVMYATLWSGNWQIVWGLLMFPANWIPLPSPAVVTTPADMGSYLRDTLICFFGRAPTDRPSDAVCASPGGSAFVWFMVYLVFNVSFNVLLLWLTKRMSATWATIATVLCLDLTCLFSMSRALMGDEAQSVTLEQYLGLLIAAIAMLVYNLRPELDKDGRQVEGVHAIESRASLPTVASFASDRSFVGRDPSRPSFSTSRRLTPIGRTLPVTPAGAGAPPGVRNTFS